jgi:hypothetical protein
VRAVHLIASPHEPTGFFGLAAVPAHRARYNIAPRNDGPRFVGPVEGGGQADIFG